MIYHLSFLKPEVYYDLVEKVDLRKDAREAFVQSIVDEVKAHLDEAGIEASVGGRVKHFFSIYKKMLKQNKTLDQIYDLFAVRIMVDTVKDCYAALGVIHEMYKPIPGRLRYIAMPKQNMYQSLHTTLIGSTGQHLRSRSVLTKCTALLSMVSQLTGNTKRAEADRSQQEKKRKN